jgi:hypothetical protein
MANEKIVSHEEALKALGKDKKKKEKPKYKSQDGFVHVPVLRGFTEVSNLFHTVNSNGGLLLGGYVRYICSPCKKPAPSEDIDVYCPTIGVFESLTKTFKRKDFKQKAENDLALTYEPFKYGHPMFPCPRVQLIKPMVEGVVVTKGNTKRILENFDFTVVRIGLKNPGQALADADFIHDETNHFLRIKNIHCPISTIYRLMKYNRKGYWPPTHQITRVFLNWDSRDDDYKAQIYGFFEQVEQDAELTQEEIDEMERIMRVFD